MLVIVLPVTGCDENNNENISIFSYDESGVVFTSGGPIIANNIFDAFSESLERVFVFPGMDEEDFKNTMKAIILENGKTIYQMEHLYTKTGLHCDAYAFGDMGNTAEYSIKNENGEIVKNYSAYISSNVLGFVFPENIKYSDSFQSVLGVLGFHEKYETAISETEEYSPPNFCLSNTDETKSVGVSFKTWHGEPTNTALDTANATVYYNEKTEKTNGNGKVHTYFRSVRLFFSSGKLENFEFNLIEKYDSVGEPEINNDKVGIKFMNPDYTEINSNGKKYQARMEEIYHRDQKIYVIYSAKSEVSTEITVSYEGAYSADNLVSFEQPFVHAVNSEKTFTDIINYSGHSNWNNDLNTTYLRFYNFLISVEFSGGNVYLTRSTDNV